MNLIEPLLGLKYVITKDYVRDTKELNRTTFGIEMIKTLSFRFTN